MKKHELFNQQKEELKNTILTQFERRFSNFSNEEVLILENQVKVLNGDCITEFHPGKPLQIEVEDDYSEEIMLLSNLDIESLIALYAEIEENNFNIVVRDAPETEQL